MSLPNLGNNTPAPAVLPGHDIAIKEMFDIAMRNNTAWGIEGYAVPRDYVDSRKLQEVSSGKVKRPAPRELKKQDYLTDIMRATKNVPAPNKYEIVKPWVDEKNKPKAVKPTKKSTYIDDIIRESQLKPTPGPGAHNLRETEEQLKKRLAQKQGKGSERVNFLCEMEHLSNSIPGPGNYNPRQIQPKIKPNKMAPEDWKKKHAGKRNVKSANPDMGSYNPFPVDLQTFGKQYELHKEKRDINKVKTWGTSERFQGKKDSKKNPAGVPGPGMYPLMATWNGKLAIGKKEKDKNWMNKVTKGITKSIYYS